MSKRPPIRYEYERPGGALKIVMPYRDPFKDDPFKNVADVEWLKLVTSFLPRRKRRGRPSGPDPRSLARAEAAADDVLRLKAEKPRAAWRDLVEDAAAARGVNKDRVWAALRKRPEYKPRSYPGNSR